MKFYCVLILALLAGSFNLLNAQIPLSEHPRPDFMRTQWINLNGEWEFGFDSLNAGISESWFKTASLPDKIRVPFSWGSPLSGTEDLTDIAWYSREIKIPESWKGERTFLVFGACDWKSDLWIDGQPAGSHQGGYNQFEFDLTSFVTPGSSHRITLRVDDSDHPFKLNGKQGYGEAKGIWQTVFLELRGSVALQYIHFTPDIDRERVTVTARLDHPAPMELNLDVIFPNGELSGIYSLINKGDEELEFEIPIPDPHLWELDDPYLYDVTVQLSQQELALDEVHSYFGMRKISFMDLPGSGHPYVALNNRPIYLQLSLDQAYHPDGFYTYPSDDFMREEIIRSKKIGLNGNRIHIKTEIPRKLYWADKLGLLIMADVPNFWGEPGDTAKKEWEYAMREMIERDYNHPSIFSWVLFNETWGLYSGEGKDRAFRPETQEWVRAMFMETKKLDPSRLIEDNSPCNYDHVVTDLNTWHSYLPGYGWKEFLEQVVENTYEGSQWNFIGGNSQTRVPMFNSECGNVWGYQGSTGDVDWSWDYHIMMNEFRRQPSVAGWLYTEHHDVVNEWNGYYRFDRTEKYTGLSSFIPDMSLSHLHSSVYLSTGSELCRKVEQGSMVEQPLYLSVMTDRVPGEFILDYELSGYDETGRFRHTLFSTTKLPAAPWFNGDVEPLQVPMPETPGLYHLTLRLRDKHAFVYHLNFTSFLVEGGVASTVPLNRVSFDPASFSEAKWSMGQWNILEGLKVNGAGSGHFIYQLKIPATTLREEGGGATLVFEASAKKLHGKDLPEKTELGGDYMQGKGTFDPSRNPNSYPMTDTRTNPSLLRVRVNGEVIAEFFLEDDPADHRGVLSWHSQLKDRKLREAGSYGYLCKAKIPARLLSGDTALTISFEVDEGLPGGVAIYGERFGRYPFNPTILFD
ncbi:MAG: glycoside hydrolase family 2 [Bacteroidetes bacterium]|nr:glycoside hydrolase family 2 [Bacteroidota bacterium]